MNRMARALLAIFLVATGMTGLYFKVEYSGWVLFTGLLIGYNV